MFGGFFLPKKNAIVGIETPLKSVEKLLKTYRIMNSHLGILKGVSSEN